MEKDLFLCHNGTDKDWVEELAGKVEAEEWNGRPLSVFLDKWDIEGGDNIILKLNHGLTASRFVAVVLSPEMITSDWCTAEWTSVLHQDPTNRLGRLLPIRRRDFHAETGSRIQVPPLLATLSYFDFRKKDDYRKGLERLLAKLRGEAPPRGAGRRRQGGVRPVDRFVPAMPQAREEPDRVAETLISNLLPVRSLPATISSARTDLKSKRELPGGLPACVVRDGRLHTFVNLANADHVFRAWTHPNTVTRIASAVWRARAETWRWYIELLNDTLAAYLRASAIDFDPTHSRYFFTAKDLERRTRYLKWGAGTKRWVVRAPDPGKNGYWIHHAARLRFETLDENVLLSIEPTMMFTTNGQVPVPKEVAGPLAMKWTGRERNGAIIRLILLWSDALTQGKREASIPAGGQVLGIGRLPTTVHAGVGIADDRVGIGALLEFTRSELDPDTARDNLFGYLDDAAAEDLPDAADDVAPLSSKSPPDEVAA